MTEDGPFAGLEGIDHEGKTVYETADPKIRVDTANFEIKSPLPKDVKTEFPSVKDTFKKLQKGVDNNDKRTEFDSSKMKESVFEKLKRLQFEVENFAREVSLVQGGAGKVVTEHLKEESVLTETKKLEELIKDVESSRFFSIKAEDQKGIQKGLLKGLGGIKGASKKKEEGLKVGKKIDEENFVNLERRIAKMEKVFGVNQNNEETIYNIQEVLKNCEEKFSLMNPEVVELLINKVKVVNAEVHKLEKSRKGKSMETLLNEEDESEEKLTHRQIGEVFEKVQKWDVVVDEIPSLVSRLKSLKHVHSRSTKFSDDLQKLKLSEEEIKKSLIDNTEILKKVEGSFKKQLDIVEKNTKALDSKMNELIKKIQKLEKM